MQNKHQNLPLFSSKISNKTPVLARGAGNSIRSAGGELVGLRVLYKTSLEQRAEFGYARIMFLSELLVLVIWRRVIAPAFVSAALVDFAVAAEVGDDGEMTAAAFNFARESYGGRKLAGVSLFC